ncbi:hypothetical protein [Pseudomonas veronii]
MQEVNVLAHIPSACADEVFAVISDFSNYVRAVRVGAQYHDQ